MFFLPTLLSLHVAAGASDPQPDRPKPSVSLGTQPARATGGTVLLRFSIGSAPTSLGFEEYDTEDHHARLTSVDEQGTAYILDMANRRVVIVRDGRPKVYEDPLFTFDVLGLGRGEFVVSGQGGLRIIDARGATVAQGSGVGVFAWALPGGGFVAFGSDQWNRRRYFEYTNALDFALSQPDVDGLAPTAVKLGDATVVKHEGRCWVIPTSVRYLPGRTYSTAGHLRFLGADGPAEARSTGETIAWRLPEGQYRKVPAELQETARWRDLVAWERQSDVLGLDGKFYSLAQAPDHYELIRWDLSRLPKQTFPPIANAPPTLVFDGPTTATPGGRLIIWVRGRDTEPGRLTFTSSNLPTGAELQPKQSGKKAAFVWTPEQDQVDQHIIKVTVEDAMCTSTTRELKVTVEPSRPARTVPE